MGRARRQATGLRDGRGRGASGPGLRPCAGLVALVAVVGLSAGSAAWGQASRDEARVPLLYQQKRSFRIPFKIDKQSQSQLKQVELWVSEDSGYNWEGKSQTTPDLGHFVFRARHDGEYWFATRTKSLNDEYSPPLNQQVEPSMKVVVDSMKPTVVLESDGRRGSRAGVRWEVKDEHLDPSSLTIEYQTAGAREWRKAPIRRLGLIGSTSWDAGTADEIRVRASVLDKAGNRGEHEITLPEGTAGAADFAAADAEPAGGPGEAAGSGSAVIVGGSGFPPVQEGPEPSPASAPAPASGGMTRRVNASRRELAATPRPSAAAGEWANPGGAPRGANAARPNDPGWSSYGNPSPSGNGGYGPVAGFAAGAGPQAAPDAGFGPGPAAGYASAAGAGMGAVAGGNGGRVSLLPSPRFKLQYAVEDAGPNGPTAVELWVTRDGGNNWQKLAEDADRVSPFDVDLGGEGRFGLCLVARSASGLGEQPPAPGDPPQSWVEVDATPPTVQLNPPQIGTGANAGKVLISWLVSDRHPAQRPVTIFWRPDQPGASWQPVVEGQEAMGQYIWTVPPSYPSRLQIRVEAADEAGHRGGAETTETAPVIVDRSRPRSRIIGLDPNARAGDGPGARPLR
ncbi:hypothetical protein OJF2_08200 [Aquisphaera giovannonii]|uniref:Ser-Thr-rich glycosyl-phosphatidyl-inositol-anchored membrane family protein n=1 Tax=Aquisphaera giovannonii TaxID=406548 RepID=A0A5B9VXB7_9BACT|nr:hypothetical protein [Aquisphaera giovannonii]QEH32350.1 hypothetical protein OJF2_08200 [Aquisphaera giovannonii]